MSTCGRPPNANSVGIKAKSFRISTKPANRGLTIMNLSGPLGFFAEPVTDGGSNVAPCGNKGWDSVRVIAALLISSLPSTPVNPNDEREGFVFFKALHLAPLRHLLLFRLDQNFIA